MRLTYDPEADALYLRLSDAKIDATDEVAPNVMLDLDTDGRIVGVEVLGVSLRPGADPLRVDFEILASDPAAALRAIAGWRREREVGVETAAAAE